MSAAATSELIAGFDNVILDLDGTVWVGDRATPRAADAVAAIRAAGKGLMFVTNEGRRSPEDLVRKLWSVGCTAAATEIVSAGSAIQYVLGEMEPGHTVFVIGAPAVYRHVADAGQRIVNATAGAENADIVVIVAHDDFDYAELQAATRAVLSGAAMLTAGVDPRFPAAGGPSPGTGAIAAALEYATGEVARNVGKPDPQMFRIALDRLGGGSAVVIGDHLGADVGGAHAAGLQAAVVLTGVTDRAAALAADDPRPIAVGEDLASLVLSS